MINTKMNASDEIEPTVKRVKKAINVVHASASILTRAERFRATKEKIFSCIYNIVYLYIYTTEAQFRGIQKEIRAAFKKANWLKNTTSSLDSIIIYSACHLMNT